MNITIVGAGALGNMLATKFSKNNKVKLVVKPEHVKTIKARGILFKEIDGKIINPKLEITTDIEENDWIILCVKSYDIPKIIKKVKNMNSPILCCQNGLQTLHLLMKEIKTKRLSYLVTGHGISKIKPGISEHKGRGFTYIGELSETKSDRIKKISNELKSSGIECNIVNNIQDYVWLKTIINSAINPIASLAEVKNGKLRNPELNEKVKEICEESEHIAMKKGIKLPLDPWKEINSIIEKTAENKCSMLQDLENDQKTEINAINGELIKIAKELSINPIQNQQAFSEIEKISKY